MSNTSTLIEESLPQGYVVGWWLVERRQLSCVFCASGVGWGGVGSNVVHTVFNTLWLLRSSLRLGWGGVVWRGVSPSQVD